VKKQIGNLRIELPIIFGREAVALADEKLLV
jgi:hypothetical protein